MSKQHPPLRNTLRIPVFLSAVLLFAALAWASDPPWKSKPYDQWDDNDVERVFADSPWTRTAEVPRSWNVFSANDQEQNDKVQGADRGLPMDSNRSMETSNTGGVKFFVDWASSRPMRAASARKAILHRDNKDLDVEKYANEPQEEYQIIVQSKDMGPFIHRDEKFFQANSYLQLKKSKQKISPSHVTYERDAQGVSSAIFFFPKKTASGDPTIGPAEKTVDFFCKLEESSLRVSFEPPKMVDKNGPSL
jgi:hypothetical protein